MCAAGAPLSIRYDPADRSHAIGDDNPDADVLQIHLDRRLADVYKNRQPMDPFERRYPEIKPVTYNRKK